MDKRKILIVDDEKDLADLVKMNLEETGLYNVDIACDGEEGLQRIREEHFDLIIMDVIMPKKNGFEALKELRGDRKIKWRPVIILTSRNDFKDMTKGYDLEADHYITKPFDINVLLRSIHTLLSITSARDTSK